MVHFYLVPLAHWHCQWYIFNPEECNYYADEDAYENLLRECVPET